MPNRLDLLFCLGRPLSPLYGLAMKVREKFYEKGLFRSYSLPVPVISVGNLVLGGTGKTPTVRYLAEFLKAEGYRPAIISRGYGGKSRKKVNIVSDGTRLLLGPQQAGDEPCMLARSLPGIPVLTGTRRIRPGRWAVDKLHADLLILDDGFQHLAVKRDVDLVLFDGSDLAGNSRIFPGGVLREPISALHRCNAFLLTGVREENRRRAESFGGLLRSRFAGRPVFYSSIGRHELKDSSYAAAPADRDKVFFGFCGIANPARFEESLKSLGSRLAGCLALSDHASYSQRVVDDLCERARTLGATHLVTTEKDYVKIELLRVSLPIEFLEIGLQRESDFEAYVLQMIESWKNRIS